MTRRFFTAKPMTQGVPGGAVEMGMTLSPAVGTTPEPSPPASTPVAPPSAAALLWQYPAEFAGTEASAAHLVAYGDYYGYLMGPSLHVAVISGVSASDIEWHWSYDIAPGSWGEGEIYTDWDIDSPPNTLLPSIALAGTSLAAGFFTGTIKSWGWANDPPLYVGVLSVWAVVAGETVGPITLTFFDGGSPGC